MTYLYKHFLNGLCRNSNIKVLEASGVKDGFTGSTYDGIFFACYPSFDSIVLLISTMEMSTKEHWLETEQDVDKALDILEGV